MYSILIIRQSHISNYSAKNQRDILFDIVENVTQIGNWTLEGFAQEKTRIELYLKLTRKDVNALLGFPQSPDFEEHFSRCCRSFSKLEKQYHAGIEDHKSWANGMISLGSSLTQTAAIA